MTLVKRTLIATLLGGIIFAGLFSVSATQVNAQEETSPVESSYQAIQSQGIIFAGICSSRGANCPCRDRGDCTLDNVLQVFVNISSFILGISGSIVLLMFVYGGFVWLTSGGNENRVKKGKDILVGTIIGLAIIFGSYAAITILLQVLKFGSLPTGTASGGSTTLEEAAETPGFDFATPRSEF